MIYTLTLNPSTDYIIEVPTFQLGELNRISSESKFPGGKGINVSRLLKRLGTDSKALGYTGGFTGRYTEDYLNNEGIETGFIPVNGDSRINIKLKSQSETEINGNGPQISSEDISALLSKIELLQTNDVLVLAGSVPSTMPADIYEKVVNICKKNSVGFVVDAEEKLLKSILHYQPFLIKPNHHELGEFFETKISGVNDAIYYGRKLLELGAENIIVSLAEKGAVFINKELTYLSNVPSGKVQSSVGAGDSMVAGFLATYQKDNSLLDAFRYSVASGSATAFSIGLCTKETIEKLVPEIKIIPFES